MTPKNHKQTEAENGGSGIVELIAGPRCGDSITWIDGMQFVQVKYHAGFATYRYEGNQKAVYDHG